MEGTKRYVVDGHLAPDHQGFHSSYENKSCTSVLNATEIPAAMQSKIKKGKHDVPLFIADTPGFEDTRGC